VQGKVGLTIQDDPRETNAELGAPLPNKAGRLILDTFYDSLNFASYGMERSNQFHTSQDRNIAELYKKCDFDLVIIFRSKTDAEVFDLILRGIPLAIAELESPSDSCLSHERFRSHPGRSHRN